MNILMKNKIFVMCIQIKIFYSINKYCPPLWNRRQHARLSRSGPGFDSRSGQVSWVRLFSGIFLTCMTNVGNIQIHKFPECHILLVRIHGCENGVYQLSCSCFLGSGPGTEQISSSGDAIHVLVWSKKYYVIQS